MSSLCATAMDAGKAATAAMAVPTAAALRAEARIRAYARQVRATHNELQRLATNAPRDFCQRRYLFYVGDENYGLGNVLYDVASAAAAAAVLNRSLVYAHTRSERKFAALLRWEGVPTMEQVDELRKTARCSAGSLRHARSVTWSPDRCTFHKTWKRARSRARCFKRMLGTDWASERAPVLELTKVHAFAGLQLFLKSAHHVLRAAVASATGGCIADGMARPNLYGVMLAELMRPVPAVLHALRWFLQQASTFEADVGAGAVGRRQQVGFRRPALVLHVRTMSDHRAKNLTISEQRDAVQVGLRCFLSAASSISVGGAITDGRSNHHLRTSGEGGKNRNAPIAAMVSSSPDLRDEIVARAARWPEMSLLAFDWRKYLKQAPPKIRKALERSEAEADLFCQGVNASQTHRCNRSAHIKDWGPDPHWVAVVELLIASSAQQTIIGAGFPHFKVCNTFTQIAAALAAAAPDWLCPMEGEPPTACVQRRSVALRCAASRFSTDWGSSAWRRWSASHSGGGEEEFSCSRPHCMPIPLHPELWSDMAGPSCASGESQTMAMQPKILGEPVVPVRTRRQKGK